MKRSLTVFIAITLASLIFAACGAEPQGPTDEYSYLYEPEASTLPVTSDFEITFETPSFDRPTAETVPVPTYVPITESVPSVPQTEPTGEVPTTAQPATEPTTVFEGSTELATDENGNLDLHVELPDANGTMVVSTAKTNPYIQLVSSQRGIETDKLVAVYTVPQTGQNYVFEFNGAGRTVDDIRRVYLIDADSNIVSVAAADDSEKEKISATENWFCMNVLIKKMIFPKIEGEIN